MKCPVVIQSIVWLDLSPIPGRRKWSLRVMGTEGGCELARGTKREIEQLHARIQRSLQNYLGHAQGVAEWLRRELGLGEVERVKP
ncbi:MAG: hypothetical protein KGL39_28885 [Patescibacteria group bacterium]|nr:hypothetical protein [Patescibacteria group bacterium]